MNNWTFIHVSLKIQWRHLKNKMNWIQSGLFEGTSSHRIRKNVPRQTNICHGLHTPWDLRWKEILSALSIQAQFQSWRDMTNGKFLNEVLITGIIWSQLWEGESQRRDASISSGGGSRSQHVVNHGMYIKAKITKEETTKFGADGVPPFCFHQNFEPCWLGQCYQPHCGLELREWRMDQLKKNSWQMK